MKSKLLTALSLGVSMAAFAGQANALTIKVTDGANTVTCADGAGCDTNANVGIVSFSTALGAAWLDISSTGYGPNLIPGFVLDLKSGQLSTSGPATVDVMLTETGFTTPGGTLALTIGGTQTGSGDSVVARAYGDSADGAFALTDLLADTGSITGTPFSASASGAFSYANPYSLTLWTRITHPGASLTTYDANLRVPEPGSLALLGLGLLGLGMTRRRKA